jgi:hypothetical protein
LELSQTTYSSTEMVSARDGLFTVMQMRCDGQGARSVDARAVAVDVVPDVAKRDENSSWQKRQRSDVPGAERLNAPEAG